MDIVHRRGTVRGAALLLKIDAQVKVNFEQALKYPPSDRVEYYRSTAGPGYSNQGTFHHCS